MLSFFHAINWILYFSALIFRQTILPIFIFVFSVSYIFFFSRKGDRQSEQSRGRERERERERRSQAGSEVSKELDVGLKLTNHEIMT